MRFFFFFLFSLLVALVDDLIYRGALVFSLHFISPAVCSPLHLTM